MYSKPELEHLIEESCLAVRVVQLLDTSPANPEGQQQSLDLSPLLLSGCGIFSLTSSRNPLKNLPALHEPELHK